MHDAAMHAKNYKGVSVLHIGNIANNAYNNAKLLRKAGVDCDVICYDYYHIMGCPEWEDADFQGDVGDHFRPDWTRVRLNGFKRPKWFVQGPQIMCIEYLLAKRERRRADARRLWRHLSIMNKTVSPKVESPLTRLRLLVLSQARRYAGVMLAPSRVARYVDVIARELQARLVRVGAGNEQGMSHVDGRPFRRPLSIREQIYRIVVLPAMRVCLKATARSVRFGLLLGRPVFGVSRSIIIYVSRLSLKSAVKIMPRLRREALYALTSNMRNRLCETFPDRRDNVRIQDIVVYEWTLPYWKRLFEHYDIIQAYATDPILPMLAEVPYFAFEHGTLREIPFEENAVGRLTSLAYNAAEHVFVTNQDCIEKAQTLCGDRFTFINHPFDEDHPLQIHGADLLRESLKRDLDADFLFFFPTRHDWVGGTGFADKANDVFIRAFGELRRRGRRVGMVCCKWGKNVAQSRTLLELLGCSKYTVWYEPMGVVQFERTALASDLAVDQFKLGAFGGVTFKLLAAGVPVCTYLDEQALTGLFVEPPPVINCRTSEEIVVQSELFMDSPQRLQEAGRESREWMKVNHGGTATVRAQLGVYQRFLSGRQNGESNAARCA